MAKFVTDNALDAALDYIINNAAEVVLCRGQPASYAEAQTNFGSTVAGGGTARRLGEATIGSSNFTGPANGDSSGRKLTFNQLTGLSITTTSTAGADHVAIVTSSTASELLLVTTISNSQAVSSGNTATINAFDDEIADAS